MVPRWVWLRHFRRLRQGQRWPVTRVREHRSRWWTGSGCVREPGTGGRDGTCHVRCWVTRSSRIPRIPPSRWCRQRRPASNRPPRRCPVPPRGLRSGPRTARIPGSLSGKSNEAPRSRGPPHGDADQVPVSDDDGRWRRNSKRSQTAPGLAWQSGQYAIPDCAGAPISGN